MQHIKYKHKSSIVFVILIRQSLSLTCQQSIQLLTSSEIFIANGDAACQRTARVLRIFTNPHSESPLKVSNKMYSVMPVWSRYSFQGRFTFPHSNLRVVVAVNSVCSGWERKEERASRGERDQARAPKVIAPAPRISQDWFYESLWVYTLSRLKLERNLNAVIIFSYWWPFLRITLLAN